MAHWLRGPAALADGVLGEAVAMEVAAVVTVASMKGVALVTTADGVAAASACLWAAVALGDVGACRSECPGDYELMSANPKDDDYRKKVLQAKPRCR